MEGNGNIHTNNSRRSEIGKPMIGLICGSLVYYHCAHRNAGLLSLVSDVLIVLLCSLAILGLLFRQMNISVPVDPLEWQISQDTANSIVAWFANTIGAAESVLRVAATGHDKRLFFRSQQLLFGYLNQSMLNSSFEFDVFNETRYSQPNSVLSVHMGMVVICLYILSILGRLLSGFTVAYAALCLFYLYVLVENSRPSSNSISLFLRRTDGSSSGFDSM